MHVLNKHRFVAEKRTEHRRRCQLKNMLKGVLKNSSRKAIEIHVFVTFQQKKRNKLDKPRCREIVSREEQNKTNINQRNS